MMIISHDTFGICSYGAIHKFIIILIGFYKIKTIIWRNQFREFTIQYRFYNIFSCIEPN